MLQLSFVVVVVAVSLSVDVAVERSKKRSERSEQLRRSGVHFYAWQGQGAIWVPTIKLFPTCVLNHHIFITFGNSDIILFSQTERNSFWQFDGVLYSQTLELGMPTNYHMFTLQVIEKNKQNIGEMEYCTSFD
jgi:hypothetical protein